MPDPPGRSTYTALDFLAFRESDSLDIAPKFQRRAVWKTPARSYFIDTLIRGYPVPPIYLRVTQSGDRRRTIREVIDGQQRVRALLGFLDGDFALSRTLDAPWAGLEFDELALEHQDAIREFSFICEVMHGVSDAEILEIFARLNTYSVQLNAQELRNGTYFGRFKQSAYRLAHEHVEFWRMNRIMTETSIARMLEVELTSELMIVVLDGLQDKKGTISRFYADYDDSFPQQSQVEERFRAVIDEISEALADGLRESQFKRGPLFYSLFGAVCHRRFGVPGISLASPTRRLQVRDRRGLRDAVARLSEVIEIARDDGDVPRRYVRFVNAALRQTDNLQPRRTRLETIYRAAF